MQASTHSVLIGAAVVLVAFGVVAVSVEARRGNPGWREGIVMYALGLPGLRLGAFAGLTNRQIFLVPAFVLVAASWGYQLSRAARARRRALQRGSDEAASK